ncbi:phosphoribosylaminoimidazolesuccinocarboxamide synthase [Bacteroidales bacterium OttesenSCG-928-B11]|nr:phosphoribosylaminoimidazolesuccinocarboxamide synthase [Bacteroidales bacterium OttesenSCG-928-C03]MDL2312045.1 phosphoribosylaminoimidazolesuccinocarboxamide synthase [Bacteroidales bacterium OttesenSCG-928-B11]MDL2326879.1 phosphoribosylaminoimidazolesuccinocarboxamide synthase [Bacteroidales bacterium OttesenSCG-928-A14]
MEKREFLYDGKAKQLYATDDPNLVIMLYKDDASAYNGVKKSSIKNKGVLNNRISELIFMQLEKNGVRTHFVKRLDDSNQLCKKLDIIPLEFIVRNVVAGSLARRLDIEEGFVPANTIYEICYKNDELRDPFINETHAMAMNLVTREELDHITDLAKKINKLMIDMFDKVGITVVDFKMEFGRDSEGNILLADEISPDSARFWDSKTKNKLDKDRFRRDMGKVEEAYREVLERLSNND